jgi:DNA-cytosine methyltransferase
MKHGSLFSGIGGFDLAAEWMGWENVFHCEWMEFPRKVLDYHFPNADSHIDICKTDFKKYANKIDILTGGFPCQPFSLAGKRKGTDDERYLWGEMLRAIQEIKPKYVIAENVFGITNIDGGLVFEQVCLDLENEGYEVQPFIICAAAKNAPHRRDRCWFIAQNPLFSGCVHGESHQEGATIREFGNTCPRGSNGIYLPKGDATDPKCEGLEGHNREREGCTEHRSDKRLFIGTETKFNATNSNSDGLNKQWRYDSSRQNDARCNTPFKWSANSKNFDNGDTSTNLVGQSTIDARIGEQANVETNQLATAEGICRLDTECDQFKGIIKLNRCETLNGGTLVQDGCEGIQSPQHRGMDKDCGDISGNRTNECEDDGTIINRMDGDATNTNGNGFNERNGNNEINTSQRGEYALGDISKSNGNGDATDTNGIGSVQRNSNLIGKLSERNGFKTLCQPTNWQNFPTQSPVCGGDDGLPTELDGITFPKWRAESIKGYGNAIVPQIAYQLFEIIQELNENN